VLKQHEEDLQSSHQVYILALL